MQSYDIHIVQETWLNETVTNETVTNEEFNSISNTSYEIVRNDRLASQLIVYAEEGY